MTLQCQLVLTIGPPGPIMPGCGPQLGSNGGGPLKGGRGPRKNGGGGGPRQGPRGPGGPFQGGPGGPPRPRNRGGGGPRHGGPGGPPGGPGRLWTGDVLVRQMSGQRTNTAEITDIILTMRLQSKVDVISKLNRTNFNVSKLCAYCISGIQTSSRCEVDMIRLDECKAVSCRILQCVY